MRRNDGARSDTDGTRRGAGETRYDAGTTGHLGAAGADNSGKAEAGDAKEKGGLRPAQIVAGGIAATTAAFLCSFFGVYGTVIGTGAISVLSTVGSEFYLRSARKSKEAAKRAKVKASAYAEAKGRTATLPREGAGPDSAAGTTRTMALPNRQASGHAAAGPDQPTRRIVSNADQPTDYLGVPAGADTSGGGSAWGRWLKRRWPILAVTSAVVFAIGMFVVTGFELATGQSLNGQGRSTVSEIVGDRSQTGPDGDVNQERDVPDAPAPTGETAEPEQQQDDPAVPTEEAPEPTDAPTEEPAEEPTEAPTEEPEPEQPTEAPQEEPVPEQQPAPEDGGAGAGGATEAP